MEYKLAQPLIRRKKISPTSIITRAGTFFDFADESTWEFRITTIAWALARIHRFNGHCIGWYSVAEHCVRVSELVSRDNALAGLLHDAHEAFVGDVSGPLKTLLPDYCRLENRVQARCLASFGILGIPDEVHQADREILDWELEALFAIDTGTEMEVWGVDKCWDADVATERFMLRFDELSKPPRQEELF